MIGGTVVTLGGWTAGVASARAEDGFAEGTVRDAAWQKSALPLPSRQWEAPGDLRIPPVRVTITNRRCPPTAEAGRQVQPTCGQMRRSKLWPTRCTLRLEHCSG